MRKTLFLAMIFFAVTVMSGMAGDDSSKPAASPSAAGASAVQVTQPSGQTAVIVDNNPGCLVDAAAIEDLKKRKDELDSRQRDLDAREADLKLREQAVSEEFKKIQAARDDLEKIADARAKENDAKVAKLVETFETMSPKAASQLLASLDDRLAVAAMARISTLKLAKILNVMDPTRSSKLSELLAGVVRAGEASHEMPPTASNDAAATASQSAKGGDKK